MGFLPQPLQPIQPQRGPQVENAEAISALRSGKVLSNPYQAQGNEESQANEAQNEEVKVEEEPTKEKLGGEEKGKGKLNEDPSQYQPRAPFPSTLKAKPIKNLA